jgi:hexosaminidase
VIRLHRALTAVGTLVGLAAPVARAQPMQIVSPNLRPQTIPAIREWRGAEGTLRLSRALRIVLRRVDRRRLSDTAGILAADLRTALGRRPSVVTRRARPGDIRLGLATRDRRLGSEGYELTIGPMVMIRARTATGVFYGTRTLLQLVHQGSAIARGRARDWPRYPERGVMIDLGRRVYPASWIEAEIRRMAYIKLNLLHLHLTDDQRWGIESETHPELASKDALTRMQLRGILGLASRYHVTVVPEIDMPGHMGALLAKHPDLELKAPAGSGSGKLDISNPAALMIVRQLLAEYLPLFPGRYWDMGADEYLTPAQLRLYPQLTAFATRRYGARATAKDAIIGFVNWVDRIVRDHHKTLRAWHDELAPGTVLRARADIVVDWWTNISPLSDPHPPQPMQLLAAGHRISNEGWFPTYFTGDVGPIQGMPDMSKAYESWSVNQFCGPTVADAFIEPCYVVSPSERRNLGSSINVWDDRDLSLQQISAGLYPRVRVLAQKTWDSRPLTLSYERFRRIMAVVGDVR